MAPASLIVSPHGEGGKGAGANKAEAHAALVAAGLTPTADTLVKEVHKDTSRLGTRRAMTSPTTAGSLQDARTRSVAASETWSMRRGKMPFSSQRGLHWLVNPTSAGTWPVAEGTGSRRSPRRGQGSRAWGA